MWSASDQGGTDHVYLKEIVQIASTLSIASFICKIIMLSINFVQTTGPTTVKISSDMDLF